MKMNQKVKLVGMQESTNVSTLVLLPKRTVRSIGIPNVVKLVIHNLVAKHAMWVIHYFGLIKIFGNTQAVANNYCEVMVVKLQVSSNFQQYLKRKKYEYDKWYLLMTECQCFNILFHFPILSLQSSTLLILLC